MLHCCALQKFAARQLDDGVMIRLPWLHWTVYPSQLRVLLEFKQLHSRQGGASPDCCRFCDTELNAGNRRLVVDCPPSLERVCMDEECMQRADASCTKMLTCGHACGGVKDEATCLPCVHGCEAGSVDGDAYCRACLCETVARQPSLRLGCGHTFHAACLERIVRTGPPGPAITFAFLGCPSCRVRTFYGFFCAACLTRTIIYYLPFVSVHPKLAVASLSLSHCISDRPCIDCSRMCAASRLVALRYGRHAWITRI